MNEGTIIIPDSDFIKKLTKELEEKNSRPDALYVDGHVELPWFMSNNACDSIFDELEKGPVTTETITQSGFRLFTTAIRCQDIYNGEKSLSHFTRNLEYAKRILGNVAQVKDKGDIEELETDKDAIGTIFLLENADSLTANTGLIISLREKGIYIVGLTHTGTNRIADGDSVQQSDGITPEGRDVIRGLLDNNILIDTAHLHRSCFWKLMDIIETPCVSSHTGISERCNIPGNINLEQAKQIFDREGLVGITFNPGMLSPDGEADVEDIFIHIDTVIQKFGPDFVAIGSDFCGFDTHTAGMEDYTGVSDLKKRMSDHGYLKNDIEKIMGLNWLRIFKKIL